MNRRQFLQSLLATGAVAAAPKFIFDVGANLWKKEQALICISEEHMKALAAWASTKADILMLAALHEHAAKGTATINTQLALV